MTPPGARLAVKRWALGLRATRAVLTLACPVAAPAILVTSTADAQAPSIAPDTTTPDSVFRRAGTVLHWNVVARELVGRDLGDRRARADRSAQAAFYDGNNNTRLYALVSGAQYDAIRAVADTAEAGAAADTAAAAVLGLVFPRQRTWLARELASERARRRAGGLSATRLRSAEHAGALAARPWTAHAAAELRAPPWRGRVPHAPNRWHGEDSVPSLAISLGLRPWFLSAPDEFRPPPPPALGSAAFLEGLEAVRTATEHRTRAETKATWAWALNAATLWSEMAGRVIVRRHLSERDAARALMYLNMTLSDATIACWDGKLTYWLPRPTEADPDIELSIPLPNFPSYPSAHATLFAAGAAVLGHLVPAEQAWLDSLAQEAAASRVWAGVHYPFDNAAGIRLGERVAGAALAALEMEGEPRHGPTGR